MLSLAILLAIGLGILISLLSGQADSAIYEGDFVPFYSAGYILRSQLDNRLLYDLATLARVQKDFWPSIEGVYALGYPPFYFALFIPLTLFPPLFAKALFVLFLLLCLGASTFILAQSFPFLKKLQVELFTCLFCFAPLFQATLAGQNTCLSLLLLCSSIWLFQRNQKSADLVSGLVLGLWLFKPHFAMVMIAGFLLAGRFWILPSLLASVLGLHVLSSSLLGSDWLYLWYQGLQDFVPGDFLHNSHQMVSLIGVSEALCVWMDLRGVWRIFLLAPGMIFSVAAILLCFYRIFRDSRAKNMRPMLLFELAAISVLCSPHTLYYDLTLVIPAFIPWISDLKMPLAFISSCLIFATLAVAIKSFFAISPLFLLSLAALYLILLRHRSLLKKVNDHES